MFWSWGFLPDWFWEHRGSRNIYKGIPAARGRSFAVLNRPGWAKIDAGGALVTFIPPARLSFHHGDAMSGAVPGALPAGDAPVRHIKGAGAAGGKIESKIDQA